MTPDTPSNATPSDITISPERANEATLTENLALPVPAPSNLTADVPTVASGDIAPAARVTESTKPPVEPDFYRVLVRRAGATKHSTVSISKIDYEKLLRFAYGNVTLVHSALRVAALRVELTTVALDEYATITGQTRKRQDFSAAVRGKALKMLQGSYRPDVAAKMAMTAEERVAAENNAAWGAQ
jgi:hypothetical protein